MNSSRKEEIEKKKFFQKQQRKKYSFCESRIILILPLWGKKDIDKEKKIPANRSQCGRKKTSTKY